MNMKLQLVTPGRGARWVRQGFAVFFRRPLAFSALFAGFLFALLLLLVIPWVGAVLLLMFLPLASAGFMIATQIALQGKFPLATVFIAPLRKDKFRRIEQLKLGVIYAVASIVIMYLSDFIDDGRFDALQETMIGGKASQEQLQALLSDPMLHIGMIVRLTLASLLSLPFWHAPSLIHWGSQTAVKALFFSTVASWRNKGAFAVYGLTWIGVIVMFGFVVTTTFALLGHPEMVAVAAMPAALIFSTAFYASLYFTFADCFAVAPAAVVPIRSESNDDL
ncbi:BPSS1780 family membrane protein [soil metagenome]